MSDRQARIARKARQRAGDDVYVHDRPAKGTRPYETREQAKQRRRKTRVDFETTAAAFRLAKKVAPAVNERLMDRHGFGDAA